jgi:hypothetical protein
MECLTALEDLRLSSCDLEPSCLLSMTAGLTSLSLSYVNLEPRQAQQGGALGASQLLQLLARLSALWTLELRGMVGDWPQQPALYSALTSSINLRVLHIRDCNIPGAAWAHAFPVGLQLPDLHTFNVRWAYYHRPAALDSAAIARLASCCPAVKDLHIDPCADASLAPLQSLSALTSLDIGRASLAAISSDLPALTQLINLSIFGGGRVAGIGLTASDRLQRLLPLSALTGLTRVHHGSCCLWLESKVSDWLDLHDRMTVVSTCGPSKQPACCCAGTTHFGTLCAVESGCTSMTLLGLMPSTFGQGFGPVQHACSHLETYKTAPFLPLPCFCAGATRRPP